MVPASDTESPHLAQHFVSHPTIYHTYRFPIISKLRVMWTFTGWRWREEYGDGNLESEKWVNVDFCFVYPSRASNSQFRRLWLVYTLWNPCDKIRRMPSGVDWWLQGQRCGGSKGLWLMVGVAIWLNTEQRITRQAFSLSPIKLYGRKATVWL